MVNTADNKMHAYYSAIATKKQFQSCNQSTVARHVNEQFIQPTSKHMQFQCGPSCNYTTVATNVSEQVT